MNNVTDVNECYVVVGGPDKNITIIDLSDFCLKIIKNAHVDKVSCILLFDSWVVSGDNSGFVKIWDLQSLKMLKQWKAH